MSREALSFVFFFLCGAAVGGGGGGECRPESTLCTDCVSLDP